MRNCKIPLDVYRQGISEDCLVQARFFLGKRLVVASPQGRVAGLITETEAYGGMQDLACHGSLNRRTPRTQMLFAAGGVAYVYRCYGIHWMLNFVVGPPDHPLAVLIRAVAITDGQEIVRQRRKGILEKEWSSGPGKVASAFAITGEDNGCSLIGNRIWVEDSGHALSETAIRTTPRIGVDYAGEWADKPWRFLWQSKASRIEERALRNR